jgi:hypothetical protein
MGKKNYKIAYSSIEGSNGELERKTYSGTLGASSGSTVNMYISFLGSIAGSSRMSPFNGIEYTHMREREVTN